MKPTTNIFRAQKWKENKVQEKTRSFQNEKRNNGQRRLCCKSIRTVAIKMKLSEQSLRYFPYEIKYTVASPEDFLLMKFSIANRIRFAYDIFLTTFKKKTVSNGTQIFNRCSVNA